MSHWIPSALTDSIASWTGAAAEQEEITVKTLMRESLSYAPMDAPLTVNALHSFPYQGDDLLLK